MIRRRKAEQSRVMEVALLILPLLALVLLGVYLIVRDRRWVEQEARERAENLARATLNQLERAATNLDPALLLERTNRWPDGVAFLEVDSSFQLLFPPLVLPVEAAAPPASLHGMQAVLWAAAERAEFEQEDLHLASQVWTNFFQADPPEPAATIGRFKHAVLLERLGRKSEPYRAFVELLEEPVSIRSESGMPVAHLAAMKLLALLIEKEFYQNDPAIQHIVSRSIARQLAEPTEFTPYFLRQGSGSGFKLQFENGLAIWTAHEMARKLHGALRQLPISESSFPLRLQVARTNWWAFSGGANIFLRTQENMETLVRETAREIGAPLHFAVTLSGKPEAQDGKVLARAGDGALRIEVLLADRSTLYARQRQRAGLFGGVLASSVVLAGFGLVQIHRNYRRQERLNELKSNFVSSVSHELRAPLASMRLMSEGLQRGRIQAGARQREYFDFLVQECRRLSVLVENVLDFSRIEQNRKSYEFGEATVRALCEGALRTIGPAAQEHGVKLEFQPAADPQANVDALALQQALVNLLDNAVKHSKPGDVVTLSLNSDAESICIAVQDQGCGIPAEEHARIFEQFYRLGSELRRETQGVGIGLAIVKHTVEAHRGQIAVESAPGRGSIFTIRIPLRRRE